MDKDIGTTYATAAQRGLLTSRRRRPRARDWVVGITAGVMMALILGHGLVPEAHGLALAVESFLPWLGVVIAALLILALVARAWPGSIPAVGALVSWCVVFLPVMATGIAPSSAAGASEEAAGGWSVVTQNLRAGNPEADEAVEKVIQSGAAVVVLQELTGPTLERIAPAMDRAFGYRQVAGTVGVWSRFPLSQGRPLALGLGWSRAMSVQLESPDGPVQLYAVHLPSVRPGEVRSRNAGPCQARQAGGGGSVVATPGGRRLQYGEHRPLLRPTAGDARRRPVRFRFHLAGQPPGHPTGPHSVPRIHPFRCVRHQNAGYRPSGSDGMAAAGASPADGEPSPMTGASCSPALRVSWLP
ncbi:endonuclease/exonuclease/phosphatase family protein [Paenarthrobacter sp. YAF11_1]|uniref:endonuclease/exonuclease/phosphatase family protein n=1 Tax=Paenarthrobacter sp. YAF11_1 TaxID=3233074 RepID=UPI003F9E3865